MQPFNFIILDDTFNLYRLNPGDPISADVFSSSFFNITQTTEELSILASDKIKFDSPKIEPGWKALKVSGPLDFSLTGILAGIATTLAEAGISIFAVSTFDTDYILIKNTRLEEAKAALLAAGHSVDNEINFN